MLEERLEQDLKQAMLSRDSERVSTLRSIKNAILELKIAEGTRDKAMPDDKVIALLQKQAKQRQESADIFTQGGNNGKAEAELSEKSIIESYLPRQLSDEELNSIVDEEISKVGSVDRSSMGLVIGKVKGRTAGAADGARVAKIVKDRLNI